MGQRHLGGLFCGLGKFRLRRNAWGGSIGDRATRYGFAGRLVSWRSWHAWCPADCDAKPCLGGRRWTTGDRTAWSAKRLGVFVRTAKYTEAMFGASGVMCWREVGVMGLALFRGPLTDPRRPVLAFAFCLAGRFRRAFGGGWIRDPNPIIV
jgi:hypothetical protein